MSADNFDKLMTIANPLMHDFVADAVELCQPDSVMVCTDAKEDIEAIRQMALNGGGETKLAAEGHTFHFDGYNDQARDPKRTKYLVTPEMKLGKNLSQIDKKEGVEDVRSILAGSMKGKQMLVAFFCLGPINSKFSISCVQVTDSPYVVHSESILYRPGYEQFKRIGDSDGFFKFIHTEGETENQVSINTDKRRIYMDLEDNQVYSTNTQYAGNTVGLKKLALRLGIQKASNEGWLAEHMFVMGAHGPNKRVSYFAGAFPSACGKTSTSMISGQTIVGDDIAYLRKEGGEIRVANVEQGIFGIIRDVNPTEDPEIYKSLTTPGEVIFGNVLITDEGRPMWLGMGEDLSQAKGTNHGGEWTYGKKDEDGNEITASHKNARYTVGISSLDNRDPLADAPEGVPLSGIFYGGRDSDTCVPVEQAFNWTEGIILKGASIESETTAAVLGAEGVRKFDLMSNLAFISVPLGKYIQSNIDFADGLDNVPSIFSVNYFLKNKEGQYLNTPLDKKVWLLWAELRVNGDVDAIETPTGYIPLYKDLAALFKDNLGHDYTQGEYVEQFTIRIPELLAKIDRVEKIYKETVASAPAIMYETFDTQRKRLEDTKAKHGEYISPFDLIKK
ncbi:MAG: phosphoenolpyruvate carboxykinase (GTP) [Planctomycetes bacterium]|nr:phosphoenolpyruvate carboxykinase (GTP) [Planctomycetota bacterium]